MKIHSHGTSRSLLLVGFWIWYNGASTAICLVAISLLVVRNPANSEMLAVESSWGKAVRRLRWLFVAGCVLSLVGQIYVAAMLHLLHQVVKDDSRIEQITQKIHLYR